MRERHLGRREVDADRNRAAFRRRSGGVARPRGDIEQARAFARAHGVEQRPDRLTRETVKMLVVPGADLFPPGVLEVPEGLAVGGRRRFHDIVPEPG